MLIRHASPTGCTFIAKQEWRPFSPRCGWNNDLGLYFPYKDYKGFWTFGIGHLILTGEDFNDGRTFQQVDELFKVDLVKYETPVQYLNSLLAAKGIAQLEDHEFDPLVDFAFNEGVGSLDPTGNSAVRALLAGRRQDVPALLLPWDVTGGVHDPGLHHRRESEGYVWSHPYPTEPTELDRYFTEVRVILAKAPMFAIDIDTSYETWEAERRSDRAQVEELMARTTIPAPPNPGGDKLT